MATIKDVSEYAGVSQATVSRVVNGSCRVSHDKNSALKKRSKCWAIGQTPSLKRLLLAALAV
ncbi:Transcriptional regulator, LacI family [Vibrio vulnificus]|nr:Transcriptional regulator, LacI family [Vibrio vulnificus]